MMQPQPPDRDNKAQGIEQPTTRRRRKGKSALPPIETKGLR